VGEDSVSWSWLSVGMLSFSVGWRSQSKASCFGGLETSLHRAAGSVSELTMLRLGSLAAPPTHTSLVMAESTRCSEVGRDGCS
jgi:hypothetical protein